MKQKSKVKKLILKIWIAIVVLLLVIASLFLFSEKVHKIGIVENVKNILVGQVEEKKESQEHKIEAYDETKLENENNNNNEKEISQMDIYLDSNEIYPINTDSSDIMKVVEKSSINNEFHQFITSSDFSYDGINYYCQYTKGKVTINDANGVYDFGVPDIVPNNSGKIKPNAGTYYNPIVSGANGIVSVTVNNSADGLRINFKPGTKTGTTTVKVSISFYYTTTSNSPETVPGNLYFWYTVTNDVGTLVEKPVPPTDEEIYDFYNGKYAIIVRCVDNSAHNGTLGHLAIGSYEIGEVEVYTGQNEDLSIDEWIYMCSVYIDQNYYLNMWHRNFQSSLGTHYFVDSNKKVIAPFYYFGGGYCSYAGTNLNEGWYCLTEDAPIYVDITHEIQVLPTYTVTYTDGVSGKVVFPDQSYEELKEGNKTPKFINDKYTNSEFFEDGTFIPIREGYTFMGWTPCVNPIVSGDDADENGEITYTATWHKDAIPECDYQIEWYDVYGNTIKAPETRTGTVGSDVTVTEDDKKVNGYTFDVDNDKNILVDNLNSNKETILKLYFVKDYAQDEYTIEYYYDTVIDHLRTERIYNAPNNNELKSKIVSNEKEDYKFDKIEEWTNLYNVTKIYYVSKNSENPNPETGKRLYTITIENDKSGHTYNSYRVFQGDYYEKEDDEGNKTPILSNIEWGPELQKKISTENGEEKTHGDKIIELLKVQNPELYKNCETAEDVAYKLQGNDNDGDVIREFTNVVGKYLLDNNINLTKRTNTLIEEKDIDGKVRSSNYKITELEAGYYIVIDAETKEKDDAYSRYLIDVVQDVTMEVKSSIPTLKKKVIGNNIKSIVEGTGTNEENPAQYIEDEKRNTATYKEKTENYNAEDYDIRFELKSYIPETDSYSKYKFEIVDILAKGFDLDNKSIKVMLGKNEYPKTRLQSEKENYSITSTVISAENYETYKSYFEEEGKEYSQEYRQSQYGKTIILIELNDLVGQMNEGVVKKGQDVIVTYNAKLNGKGEVGTTPNTNEAYLKYSNDPYHSDKQAQTTTQITYTYTIDLILNKIAELKSETDEIKYLSGAEFEIYDGPEYIKEAGSLLPIKNSTRKLIATITTDEIKDAEGNIINEVGHASYNSLAAGTYYLKETKSPEGYNKLREEIKVEINAICDEFGAITWTVEDKEKNKLVRIQIKENEIVQEKVNEETGDITTEVIATIPEVNLQVENTSGFNLPVTGGTGTAIFTVVGISIMLIAVTFLKSNRKEN